MQYFSLVREQLSTLTETAAINFSGRHVWSFCPSKFRSLPPISECSRTGFQVAPVRLSLLGAHIWLTVPISPALNSSGQPFPLPCHRRIRAKTSCLWSPETRLFSPIYFPHLHRDLDHDWLIYFIWSSSALFWTFASSTSLLLWKPPEFRTLTSGSAFLTEPSLVWVMLSSSKDIFIMPCNLPLDAKEVRFLIVCPYPSKSRDGWASKISAMTSQLKGNSSGLSPGETWSTGVMSLEYCELAPTSLMMNRKYPEFLFLEFSKPIRLQRLGEPLPKAVSRFSLQGYENIVISINPRHKSVHGGEWYSSLQFYFLDPVYWFHLIISNNSHSTRLRMHMALIWNGIFGPLGPKGIHHQGKENLIFGIVCSERTCFKTVCGAG